MKSYVEARDDAVRAAERAKIVATLEDLRHEASENSSAGEYWLDLAISILEQGS